MASAPDNRPPTIDPNAAARWAYTAPAATPWLHEEVARRMEERLGWIKLKPSAWMHWSPLRGGVDAHHALVRRYPKAHVYLREETALATAQARRRLALPWWSPRRWFASAPRAGAPAQGAVQMVWANMTLHMAADPQGLIDQWQRALSTDGFLMFSCLGPDTLRELRRVYEALGWPAPAHEFTDMHDWGDMLVHAGFAEPVMDMERIVLTYETPGALLRDLRDLGRNLHPARFGALRGRKWRRRLEEALARGLADPSEGGRLSLTFEIIYGHAFRPAPRVKLAPQSAVSLGDMRAMLRDPRGAPATGR